MTFSAVLALLLALTVSGQTWASDWQAVELELKKRVPTSTSSEEPGFILALSDNGETPINLYSGAADIEQGRLIDGNTVFHIASLSKQITGAALAHAIGDGKISLEDTVSDWLPATSKYGSQLKVKHLVYMTSGLTEYTNVARADGKPWATFHYFSIHDAIAASLSLDSLQFEPGDQWQYSNINYMLITELVSKAYQQPFHEVVRDKIFLPLGMNQSLINDDITQLVPNRANAYLDRSGGVLNELNIGASIHARAGLSYVMIRRNSPHYGGSGVMTSMNDWMKWQSEIITQKSFGKTFWNTMLSTMAFKHEKINDAFGLVHGQYGSDPILWYEGSDIDGSSYAITLPDRKISISCFSNNPLDSCRSKVELLMTIVLKGKSNMCGELPFWNRLTLHLWCLPERTIFS